MSGQREEPVNKAENKATYSICGEGHKVLGNSRFLWKHRQDVTEDNESARQLSKCLRWLHTHIFGVFKEPCFGRLSIGYGLLGGECL